MGRTIPLEVTRERERRAWDLRQRGWTQQRIADELGITHQAVSALLKRLDRRFLAKSDDLIAAQKAAQTQQLQYIADEALQAWERSKLDAETVVTTSGRAHVSKEGDVTLLPDETKVQIQGQSGDPRLLDQARGALEDIRKVWGIDAPTKVAGPDGGPIVIRYVNDWRNGQ
jgi:predicted transcriptional regulator